MRTEVIRADTIDVAAERILAELTENTSTRSSRSRENVIYFDGWDGLGASCVLRAISQHLTAAISEAPGNLELELIIHIDCSKWESRRALQRVIAEQLGLPHEVMEIFERQDEEDDFHGVAQGSRTEIPQISEVMYQYIQTLGRRFLVTFLNGSNEEIDLASVGFPLYGYSRNKVLWTFQGRFRLKPQAKVDGALNKSTAGMTSDVFLSATSSSPHADPHGLWSYLVCQEAVDLVIAAAARNKANTTSGIMYQPPAQVAECFLYMLGRCCRGRHSIDFDLAIHGANFWVCDEIIQLQQGDHMDGDDRVWRAADALQREMSLDLDYYQYLSTHLARCIEEESYWTSTTYKFIMMPIETIPTRDMFQHFDKIGVLKLSRCTFNFSSPPFLCCHRLRFLWLDHCQDMVISIDGTAGNDEAIRQFFQRLWVLDVRYTCCDRILSAQMIDHMTKLRELIVMGAEEWDMSQLQGRLPNIRKLRVTKSSISCISCSEDDLFLGMNKMELLDFSENHTISSMTSLLGSGVSNNCLETVVIDDGCVGLETIRFKGCAKLENLVLRGVFQDLRTLDMSSTAVKTLDMSAMTALKLDELFLLGCEKLCAILWPPEDKRKKYLEKLHIDSTIGTAGSPPSLTVMHGGQAPFKFEWCIYLRDARLLRSFASFEKYFNEFIFTQLEISSPLTAASSVSNNEGVKRNNRPKQQTVVNMEQPGDNRIYADFSVTFKEREGGTGDVAPCPRVPNYENLKCYIHIQDKMRTKVLQGSEEASTSISIPDFICYNAKILHVHDSLSITSIPGPTLTLSSRWKLLRWCRVERCSNLECVFTTPLQSDGGQAGGENNPDDGRIFYYLQTFWASQLPKACFIWNWSKPSSVFHFDSRAFEDVELLHVDFCPRLVHVLPLSALVINECSLQKLETLEIMWCGDLRAVFPSDNDVQDLQQHQAITVNFPSLKHIHLQELPMLQGICGRWKMSAPRLETVKIRGCWSLTRLPAVIGRSSSEKVKCDCEKDWWDKLEWDGLDAGHHPSFYKPTHSRYYKKKLLRGSVLQ